METPAYTMTTYVPLGTTLLYRGTNGTAFYLGTTFFPMGQLLGQLLKFLSQYLSIYFYFFYIRKQQNSSIAKGLKGQKMRYDEFQSTIGLEQKKGPFLSQSSHATTLSKHVSLFHRVGGQPWDNFGTTFSPILLMCNISHNLVKNPKNRLKRPLGQEGQLFKHS